MQVFAYCALEYKKATNAVVGKNATVIMCPPITDVTFDPAWLEGPRAGRRGNECPPRTSTSGKARMKGPWELIFFNLHGMVSVGAFFGAKDGPPVALRVQQLWGLDLGGAVVFATTCFLGDPKSHPMREALLEAGASAVIAGPGENYGGRTAELKGADLLGLWVRRWLAVGFGPAMALKLAKARMRWAARKSGAARDALGFRVWMKEAGDGGSGRYLVGRSQFLG